jgi:chromosome segregation ATPase
MIAALNCIITTHKKGEINMNKQRILVEEEDLKALRKTLADTRSKLLMEVDSKIDRFISLNERENSIKEAMDSYCELKNRNKELEETIEWYEEKIQEMSSEVKHLRNTSKAIHFRDNLYLKLRKDDYDYGIVLEVCDYTGNRRCRGNLIAFNKNDNSVLKATYVNEDFGFELDSFGQLIIK